MLDAKVIVIEPSDSQAQALETLLRFLDLEPVHVHDVAEFRRYSATKPHDWLAMIVGEVAIATEGRALVEHLRALEPPLPLIYLSADGLPKIAESSGDLAWFHLDFPVKQRRLSAVLDQAQKIRNGHPTQPGAHRFRPSGTSRAMRAVHRLIEQVAPHATNVLILGESGTGKEMVARHIHELSDRSGQPFVPVNCGAIPADLLESELFGHEKGAFTGALSTRLGRFEFAEGGTLFLDEIGDMSLQMQVKLLRVLQERSFERVGSNRTIKCDVRIIAATHRDLDVAISEGRFREDLFYRLNVFPIQMPPLRERLEDLPVLIEHLVQRQNQMAGRHIRLDKEAINCGAAGWADSGVRIVSPMASPVAQTSVMPETQLENPTDDALKEPLDSLEVLETLEGRRDGAASTRDVPRGGIDLQLGGNDLKDHLSAIEIALIRQALKEAGGTVAEAARLLKIRRTTLVEKLRKYRLSA